MDQSSFVARLGNLIEYSPWFAASLYECRPFASTEELVESSHEIINNMPIVGEF